MMKRFVLVIGLALLLAACSVDITQIAPTLTPAPGATGQPTIDPAAPTATENTPTLDSASLGLGGRLIYTQGALGVNEYSIAGDTVRPLFKPQAQSIVTSASVSPDGSTIVMAYAPPPEPGGVQFGYTDLYTMPSDGSALPTVLLDGIEGEFFFNPVWTPDGAYVYYGHFHPANATSFSVDRLAYPGGTPETIIAQGYWPSISRDGTMLAYLSINEQSVDSLFVAGVDGSNPREVMRGDLFEAVDAPLFAPDGQSLIFSAINEGAPEPTTEASMNWLAWLTGAKIVRAHDVPSDFWIVPTAGGDPTRLTHLNALGMFAAYPPGGERLIAFITSQGLYLMNEDGSGLAKMLDLQSSGTLSWAP